MRIRTVFVMLAALATTATSTRARADARPFIRAYEYATQPKGNLELELWNTVEAGRTTPTTIEQKVELEYGITDNWDAALYHIFKMGGPDREAYKFDAWSLETRYRFADKNVWPVDLMLYFEAERPANFSEPWELEEKIILGKEFGRFGITTNLIAAQKPGDPELEFEVDLGVRYEIVPQFAVAIEGWGQWALEEGELASNYFVGPSFRVATKRFWLQLGVGADVTHVGNFYGRTVLGFNL